METTVLVDDLDQETMKDVERIHFRLDGVEYEIDLRPSNAKALRQVFKPYVEKSRRKPKVKAKSNGKRNGYNPDARKVRAWAKEQGYEIGNNGRLHQRIWDDYRNANSN